MKVYVVTSGEFSDYRIRAICSTKEIAETAKLSYHEFNEVEEMELDDFPDETSRGLKLLQIIMKRDGETIYCIQHDPTDVRDGYIKLGSTTKLKNGALENVLWAKNEVHAIKITNELRARLIAEGNFE